MQVLPGKHAAEMPMVSPKGHCKAGLSPRQLPPSGWSPKKPVSSRLLGEGSRILEDLCLVQQDLYCVS